MSDSDPDQEQNSIDDEEASEEEEDEEEVGGTDVSGHMQQTTNNTSSSHLVISAVSSLSSLSHLREIGKEALCWQLSSAKPGNGVEQLRDGNTDSYWQSDGTKQPHWIQVHFARRVQISHVALFLDYTLDESYTPKKIFIQHGLTVQDLQAAVYPHNTEIEFHEPSGWCIIPLSSPPDPLDECQADLENENSPIEGSRQLVRTHLLRISILSMHQNGRDTHIRQVELYGPRMMNDMKGVLPQPVPGVLQSRNILQDMETEENDVEEDEDLGDVTLPAFGSIR